MHSSALDFSTETQASKAKVSNVLLQHTTDKRNDNICKLTSQNDGKTRRYYSKLWSKAGVDSAVAQSRGVVDRYMRVNETSFTFFHLRVNETSNLSQEIFSRRKLHETIASATLLV